MAPLAEQPGGHRAVSIVPPTVNRTEPQHGFDPPGPFLG
jgi:hypothetical protein